MRNVKFGDNSTIVSFAQYLPIVDGFVCHDYFQHVFYRAKIWS